MAEPSIINAPPAETAPVVTPPAETAPVITQPTLTPEEQKVADDKAVADKAVADKPVALTPEQQKVVDDKTAEVKKEVDDKAAKEGAPETYEDFKLPEGVEMDKAALDKFVPLAKELNLNQEQAQKFVDLRAETVQEESKRQWDVWETTQKEWVADSKSDKEIGGEKFEENLGVAKKAMDAYGSQALKDLADATGLGNHKEFIRLMVKVGNDITEDKLRVSGAQTKEGSRASRIYDHPTSQ